MNARSYPRSSSFLDSKGGFNMVETLINVKCDKCKTVLGKKGQVKEKLCDKCKPVFIRKTEDANNAGY